MSVRDEGLDALTAEIVAWQHQTFPHGTPESCAAHLAKEVIELCANPRDAGEIADCYFLVAAVAARAGVDLAAAVRAKLAINRGRQWGPIGPDGVVEHVRGEAA
jgi:hypothetical protein